MTQGTKTIGQQFYTSAIELLFDVMNHATATLVDNSTNPDVLADCLAILSEAKIYSEMVLHYSGRESISSVIYSEISDFHQNTMPSYAV